MPKIVDRVRFDPSAAPPLPPNASAGKRWRFRRNLVIYVAHRRGLSQRLLADVFDLPRSRIAAIIRELGQFEPGSPTENDRVPPGTVLRRRGSGEAGRPNDAEVGPQTHQGGANQSPPRSTTPG